MKPRALLVLLPCFMSACTPWVDLPRGASLGTHSFRVTNYREPDGTLICPGGVQATFTHGGTTETVTTTDEEMHAYTTPRPMKVGDPVQVDAACLAADGSALVTNSGTFELSGSFAKPVGFIPGGVGPSMDNGERQLHIVIPSL